MAEPRRPSWLARWWVLPYILLMGYATRLAPIAQRFGDIGPWLFAAAGAALTVVFLFPRVDWARTLGVVAGGVACFARAWSALFLDETPAPVVFFLWSVVALGLASSAALSWQVMFLTDAEEKVADG